MFYLPFTGIIQVKTERPNMWQIGTLDDGFALLGLVPESEGQDEIGNVLLVLVCMRRYVCVVMYFFYINTCTSTELSQ